MPAQSCLLLVVLVGLQHTIGTSLLTARGDGPEGCRTKLCHECSRDGNCSWCPRQAVCRPIGTCGPKSQPAVDALVGGVSIGVKNNPAGGTLGFIAKDREGRKVLVTAAHVLRAANDAARELKKEEKRQAKGGVENESGVAGLIKAGLKLVKNIGNTKPSTDITQPSEPDYDGYGSPRSVAKLTNYALHNPHGKRANKLSRFTDCASATLLSNVKAYPDIYSFGPILGVRNLKPGAVIEVRKYGRTSQCTSGLVINPFKEGFDPKEHRLGPVTLLQLKNAIEMGEIIVVKGGHFSEPGDSGAPVVDNHNRILGIIIQGDSNCDLKPDDEFTFVLSIGTIEGLLGVQVWQDRYEGFLTHIPQIRDITTKKHCPFRFYSCGKLWGRVCAHVMSTIARITEPKDWEVNCNPPGWSKGRKSKLCGLLVSQIPDREYETVRQARKVYDAIIGKDEDGLSYGNFGAYFCQHAIGYGSAFEDPHVNEPIREEAGRFIELASHLPVIHQWVPVFDRQRHHWAMADPPHRWQLEDRKREKKGTDWLCRPEEDARKPQGFMTEERWNAGP